MSQFPPTGKILMIRMGAMGDIVHTLPAAATLRRAFPNAEIDWLVEEHWAALLAGNPHVSSVRKLRRRNLPALLRAVGDLRRRQYDCVIDFQGLMKSAAIAGLCGAGQVIGFETPALRERPAAMAYQRQVTVPMDAHVVEKNLALAHALGNSGPPMDDVLEFPLPGAAIDLAPPFPGDYLAVSPSAGWAAKRWPAERFAELIARVDREMGWPSVVNCGPGEEELAARIVAHAQPDRARIVSGDLRTLIGLALRARAFVAGDTGPLHIAAALGTPVVAVFGPTNPRRNGPYSQHSRVVRASGVETTYSRSAGGEDIARVTVEEVFRALVEVTA
jgi:lipopolysaccharide heptosyltransferase I